MNKITRKQNKISKYIITSALLLSSLALFSCDKDNTNNDQTYLDQIAALNTQIESLTALNKELSDLKDEISKIDNENISALNNQISTLNATITSLDSQITSLNSQIDSLNSQITSLNGQVDSLDDQVDSLNSQITSLNSQIESLEAEKANLQTQINELKSDYESQIKELNEIIENAEKPTYYTVKFDMAGGNSISSQQVKEGGYVIKPTSPTKTGYTFVKWIDDEGDEWKFNTTAVMHDITLKATWTVNTYTVTFDLAGGSFKIATSNPMNVTFDTQFTLPQVQKADHQLYQWQLNGKEFKSGTWKVASDVTLKCVWAKNVNKLTYDYGYDSLTQTVDVDYGSNYSFITPSRDGYTFKGWKYNGSYVSNGKWTYLGDITVNAVWEANSYQITLDAGEGNLDVENIASATFDSTYTLPVCEPLNDNRPFAGWFIDNVRMTDEQGNSFNTWTYLEGKTFVAKYFNAISTKEDFYNIANNPSATYSLVNDIDFTGEEYIPIESFEGTLWGMGYAIKGVKITSDITEAGLFKSINNATIEDVTFKDFTFDIDGANQENNYVAGLISANATGNVTLNNINTSNINLTVDSEYTDVTLGALIGNASNLNVSNVTTKGRVEAKALIGVAYVAGLVGECSGNLVLDTFVNEASVISNALGSINPETSKLCVGVSAGLCSIVNKVTLKDTINKGTIEAYSVNKLYSYAAGLLGKVKLAPSFDNSYNQGEVNGETYAGGVIGETYSIFMLNGALNNGNVNAKYAGGVIGVCDAKLQIRNISNTGNVTSNSTDGVAGGLVGTTGTYDVDFSMSYNLGNVSSTYGSAGGLLGSGLGSSFTNCFNNSTVEGKIYAGGLLGINVSGEARIDKCYVIGLVSSSLDSTSGAVGGFIGKSSFSYVDNSFVYATLKGLDGYVNSVIGESISCDISNVVSASSLFDLTNKPIDESKDLATKVESSVITSGYIKNTLMFDEAIWNIEFDTSLSKYPTLK